MELTTGISWAAYGCGNFSCGDGADFRESVLEEIQVARFTLGALIDDLWASSELVVNSMESEQRKTYHDFDLAIRSSHLETRTTLGGTVPVGTGEGRAVQAGWKAGHCGERAHSPAEVSPVEGGRAGDGSSAQDAGRAAG